MRRCNKKGNDMSVNVLYRTSARATGGGDGHAATLDGAVDVKLSTAKELGGAGGTGAITLASRGQLA
jgi:organic hydroperoxide reductase OsmC/OhrA